MVTTNCDASLEERQIAQRRETGADRFDEVWEGVYVMSPMANDEHQDLGTGIVTVLRIVIQWAGLGEVRGGVNVSDRKDDWRSNFRCPDVAAFLKDTSAQMCGAFWHGGPDFAVEIISPNDRSREKLDFYGKVSTRELLIIDRDSWALELYRLQDQELILSGKSTLNQPDELTSDVLPLSWKLIPGEKRPQIEIAHSDGEQQWVV